MSSSIDEQAKDSIPWANPELQQKIGLIPRPSLILVEGANDSGKSVLVQQATYGALKNGFNVRYITTENTILSFLNQMYSLSFDVYQDFLVGRLRISVLHAEDISWDVYFSKMFLGLLERHLEQDLRSELFVVDSLTYIVTHADEKDVLSFFSFIRNYVDKSRKTVMITIHPYAFGQDLLIRVRSICDGHLVLEAKTVGDRVVRTLHASKLRGVSSAQQGFVAFDVDPAFGIKVVPFSQARA